MSEANPPVSTRRGDDGTTTLLGAGRLSKNDARVALLGDLDEASASLGLARDEAGNEELREILLEFQRLLYRIMGDVAMVGEPNVVGPADVQKVDGALESWSSRTEIPKEFVIPGESRVGALLDVARNIVRRAERSAVQAGFVGDHPHALKAVNRLSDVLFVLARNADGKFSLARN